MNTIIRVLKLNVNGTVEYYHPLEETVKREIYMKAA